MQDLDHQDFLQGASDTYAQNDAPEHGAVDTTMINIEYAPAAIGTLLTPNSTAPPPPSRSPLLDEATNKNATVAPEKKLKLIRGSVGAFIWETPIQLLNALGELKDTLFPEMKIGGFNQVGMLEFLVLPTDVDLVHEAHMKLVLEKKAKINHSFVVSPRLF